MTAGPLCPPKNFYPRSPCGERPDTTSAKMPQSEFLSTLSLRRATRQKLYAQRLFSDFYPRSPCGERPSRLHKNICGWGFLSTLSLRRATGPSITLRLVTLFLSTLSLRRATVNTYHRIFGGGISIHALLAESDFGLLMVLNRLLRFLSTLSLRRATFRLFLIG